MSVIIGYATDGCVHMGADTRTVASRMPSQMIAPKIWKRGEFLIGGCGSPCDLDAVRYSTGMPICPLSDEDWDAAVHRFVVGMREEFRKAGRIRTRDGVEDTDFGTREFSALDQDGNLLGFFRWVSS